VLSLLWFVILVTKDKTLLIFAFHSNCYVLWGRKQQIDTQLPLLLNCFMGLVGFLLAITEALSSTPSTAKNKQNKQTNKNPGYGTLGHIH
jgi:hypothetical protein